MRYFRSMRTLSADNLLTQKRDSCPRLESSVSIIFSCLTLVLSSPILANASSISQLPLGNRAVISSLSEIPEEGGYATNQSARSYLKESLAFIRGGIRPPNPGASFCSSATYLVLASSLRKLQMGNYLEISDDGWDSLEQINLSDGHGSWGIWNSNGPGAARLLEIAKLGHSFVDISLALPGDFLKFFWSKKIGKRERGHLVVFLGMGGSEENPTVRYWSANRPKGIGVGEVELDKIHHPIFSRLDPSKNPEIPPPAHQDKASQEMLQKSFSWLEVKRLLALE